MCPPSFLHPALPLPWNSGPTTNPRGTTTNPVNAIKVK